MGMSHDFPDGPDYNPEPLDDDPWDVDTTSQPDELCDSGLAAKPPMLVQQHPPGRNEEEVGAVEQRLALALELGADDVRQRPPERRPCRERQRHVQERDVRTVRVRQRDSHPGVLAQKRARPDGHLLEQDDVGIVLDDDGAHLGHELPARMAVARPRRHIAPVGDVPCPHEERACLGHAAVTLAARASPVRVDTMPA